MYIHIDTALNKSYKMSSHEQISKDFIIVTIVINRVELGSVV